MPPRSGAPGQGGPRGHPGGNPGGRGLSGRDPYGDEDSDGDSIDPFGDDLDSEDGPLGGPPSRGGRGEGGFMPEGQGGRHPGYPPMGGGMRGHVGGGGRGGGGGRRGGGMMPPGAAGGRHGGHHGGGPRGGAPPRAGQRGTGPWHDLFERIVPDIGCQWPDNGHGPGSICEEENRGNLMEAARQLGYHGPQNARSVEHSLGPEGLHLVAMSIREFFDEDY